MSRYRAWRFLHPDFDFPEEPGLQITPGGAVEMVPEQASVRQAVLLLLTTKPHERVMRPDYGSDLYKLVFSPNDETTAGLAIHYVKQALDRWEPRIQVLRVDATPNQTNPGQLDVILEYRVKASQQEERLSLPIQLTGYPT